MAACLVGLVISVGGLVPEKIETFGIELTAAQEQNLLQILAGIITYFLVGFSVYAWSDLERREAVAAVAGARLRPATERALDDLKRFPKDLGAKRPEEVAAHIKSDSFRPLAELLDDTKLAQRVSRAGAIRVAFDVYVPLVVGVGSVVIVLASAGESAGARWLSAFLILVAAGASFILVWRQRSSMQLASRRRIRESRERVRKGLIARLESLPEGDPLRDELAQRARRSLERAVEDYKRGYF